MKVVYNACYGGFGLSEAAIRRYAEIKGLTLYPEIGQFGFTTWWTCPPEGREGKTVPENEWHTASDESRRASNQFHNKNAIYDKDIPRADPALVRVVEELGDAANGMCARLRIEDLPAGTHYRINEYDGYESVETRGGIDWSVAQ